MIIKPSFILYGIQNIFEKQVEEMQLECINIGLFIEVLGLILAFIKAREKDKRHLHY